jgi:hypothetical protein
MQYFHFNHKDTPYYELTGSYTACATVPPADRIRAVLEEFLRNESATMIFGFGYTKVHPKDNYSKKIGRAEALKKVKELTMNVKEVKITSTHMYISLDNTIDKEFRVIFRLNTKTNHATVLCYDIASY